MRRHSFCEPSLTRKAFSLSSLSDVTHRFKIFILVFYFERESDSTIEGRAEREREQISRSLLPVSADPDPGLETMNCHIIT